jgi:hypothetical protein
MISSLIAYRSDDKKNKPCRKKKFQGKDKPSSSSGGGSGSKDERKKGACHYCGIEGHYAKDCRKAKCDREKLHSLNLSQVETEEEPQPALMLAAITELEPLQSMDHTGE